MTEKCQPDDPRRCQGVTQNGQCQYLSSEGDRYCDFHNHGAAKRRNEKREVERYILDNQELRSSYERQHSDEDYLSLRREIDLLHAIMEKRANMLKTEADYAMGTSAIMAIAQRLESMKISLLKMKQSLNMMLSVDTLKAFALDIGDILSEELNEIPNKEVIIEKIGQRIYEALEAKANGQNGDNNG